MQEFDLEIIPITFIQHDWNVALSFESGEAWISYKIKGRQSVHGKIKAVGPTHNKLSVNISPSDFKIKSASTEYMVVELEKFKLSTIFVAPYRIYSDIHKKSVESINVTTTNLAVSASVDGSLKVWDTIHGETKLNLDGHCAQVNKCKFFPSEKVILTGSMDMRMKIWCAEKGINPVTITGHIQSITDIDIVGVGRNVVSVSNDGTAKLWNVGDASCLATLLKLNESLFCCKVFKIENNILKMSKANNSNKEVETENKLLLIGCASGLYVVDLFNKEVIFHDKLEAISCIDILNNKQFIVGMDKGQVHLYSILIEESNRLKFNSEVLINNSNSRVLSVLCYKENGFFISRFDGTVTFHFLNNSSKVYNFTGSNCDPVYDLAHDEDYLYTVCRDSVIRKYIIHSIV